MEAPPSGHLKPADSSTEPGRRRRVLNSLLYCCYGNDEEEGGSKHSIWICYRYLKTSSVDTSVDFHQIFMWDTSLEFDPGVPVCLGGSSGTARWCLTEQPRSVQGEVDVLWSQSIRPAVQGESEVRW